MNVIKKFNLKTGVYYLLQNKLVTKRKWFLFPKTVVEQEMIGKIIIVSLCGLTTLSLLKNDEMIGEVVFSKTMEIQELWVFVAGNPSKLPENEWSSFVNYLNELGWRADEIKRIV